MGDRGKKADKSTQSKKKICSGGVRKKNGRAMVRPGQIFKCLAYCARPCGHRGVDDRLAVLSEFALFARQGGLARRRVLVSRSSSVTSRSSIDDTTGPQPAFNCSKALQLQLQHVDGQAWSACRCWCSVSCVQSILLPWRPSSITSCGQPPDLQPPFLVLVPCLDSKCVDKLLTGCFAPDWRLCRSTRYPQTHRNNRSRSTRRSGHYNWQTTCGEWCRWESDRGALGEA